MTEIKDCEWVLTAELPENGDIRKVAREGIKLLASAGIVGVDVQLHCGPTAADPFGDRDKLVFTKHTPFQRSVK